MLGGEAGADGGEPGECASGGGDLLEIVVEDGEAEINVDDGSGVIAVVEKIFASGRGKLMASCGSVGKAWLKVFGIVVLGVGSGAGEFACCVCEVGDSETVGSGVSS